MTARRARIIGILDAVALRERAEELERCGQSAHDLLDQLSIRGAILVVAVHLGDDTVALQLLGHVGLGPQELPVPGLQKVTQVLPILERNEPSTIS